MPTQTVTFVDERGNVTEETFASTRFTAKIDGVTYSPAVVHNVEIENDGDTTSPQDQCGHTERRRTGENGWAIRVQGIVTGNEDRTGNLSLQLLRDVIASMSELKIRSDVISGTYEVSNVVITQSNDLVSIQSDDTHGAEMAFQFQLQMGESQSE